MPEYQRQQKQIEYEHQQQKLTQQRTEQKEQEELEYQRKQEELARKRTERSQRKTKRPTEHPPDEPKTAEHSAEMDVLLARIVERSGRAEFSPANAQTWTERKRTTAYAVLEYGQQVGLVEHVARGRYVCTNGAKPNEPK